VIQEVWTNAIVVSDRFHVMKYVNEELNKILFIVLRNGVNVKKEERIKLATVLSQSKRIKLFYQLKEEFRDIFESHHSVE
jgi:transposase